MNKQALSILTVDVNSYKTQPPLLVINTSAEMSHDGHGRAFLIQRVYVTPPADGIWDFDFVAEYPDDTVFADVLTVAIAEPFSWKDFPEEIKGVRIHGSLNNKKALISQESEVRLSTDSGELSRALRGPNFTVSTMVEQGTLAFFLDGVRIIESRDEKVQQEKELSPGTHEYQWQVNGQRDVTRYSVRLLRNGKSIPGTGIGPRTLKDGDTDFDGDSFDMDEQ